MIDVKEKLVELLSVSCCPDDGCDFCTYAEFESCRPHFLADHLIANGVTVHEWISVEKRLPSKEEYTAKAEDGREYYVRLLIAYKTDTVEYEIGYYDGYKWMTEMPIRLIKDVVAWMPFPNMTQLPKVENR